MRYTLVPIFYAFLFYKFTMNNFVNLHKTTIIPTEWTKIGLPNNKIRLDFTIMLPQKNINILENALIETSDPNSPHYGKWMNKNAIDSIVYAEPQNFTSVYRWLKSSNINQESCTNTADSIICKTTIKNINLAFLLYACSPRAAGN